MNNTRLFILIIFITACTNDITFELDGHESKLVVNSFFSPNGSISVNISKSIPILAGDTLNYIDNAEIELFHHGVSLGKSSYNQNGFYTIPAQLTQNNAYTLFVSVPGMETVSSLDSITVKVPMLSFDTISIDSKYLYCEIQFQDIAEMDNYYLLEVFSENPVPNKNSVFSHQVDIIIIDNIVENGGDINICKRMYFSDERIQGATYELSFILDKEFLFNQINVNSNTVYINFKSISKDYYTYVKTYYASQNKLMNVYSNIVNGYGIFAGYNLSQDSIVIQSGK